MDFTTKVYNHSAVSYFESQNLKAKDNRWVGSSSPDVKGSPKQRNDGRGSTKKWVLKAFSSESGAVTNNSRQDHKPSDPSTSAAPVRKHSAAPLTDRNQVESNPKDKVTEETRPQLFIRFKESLITSHAEKFKFCLVGEFTDQSRPKLSLVRKWVREKWALKGKWSLTLLDSSRILVRLENDDDMLLIWTRRKWIVQGHLMKVFRWSSNFPSSKKETSLAAVWVSFPLLPLVFFEERLLHSVASLVGRVVAIDGQTRNLSRTDVARVWVEVDLSKELPNKLWIGIGNSGFWQAINYKRLPSYCANCCLQGHSTKRCKFNNMKARDKRSKLPLEIKSMDFDQAGEKLVDNGGSYRKWAQFRSLFQDAEGDTTLGALSVIEGDELKKTQMNKIVSDEDFSLRRATTEVAEDVAAATEESQGVNIGVQEQGPFDTACNIKQSETGKTISEVQNRRKVVFCEEREKGKQKLVDKEGDCSGIEKTKPKSSTGEENKRRQQVSQPIIKKNKNQSVEERTASRSFSHEKPVCFQERKESKKGESSELKEDIPNMNKLPMQVHDVETSNARETSELMNYSASDVRKMTISFGKEIGRGGFGVVFQGKLRDGRQVAVKILSKGAVKEFDREVRIIGGRHHNNIVKLLGFCSASSRRALIYEFMPNGSLDKFIGLPSSLGSKQLLQIAVGVARGLHYLHQGPSTTTVLHLDIKPANILLDENFCPKISDFGLAKEWAIGKKQSFKSTRGTHGYIAPEHLNGLKPSSKSDVYSYGVMLLEMAVGKRALRNEDLFYWAKENVNDQCLYKGILKDDTERKMIVVGLWCVQADPEDRPSMSGVLKMLEENVEDLEMPLRSFCIKPQAQPDSLELYCNKEKCCFGPDGQIHAYPVVASSFCL
ncbi:hypothetical protein H6P81_015678 [Aristolochia fimbriata]|uniref:Protein kinase domain-containing protein n=1 Tax=Aristolochia fimbriata TaxID=158543 RepID=A0AAV7E687_ARIFI|nr:hypothetical protein H6P81_015678 [Aristolochia fimbriata]